MNQPKVTGIVLAGGESRRFGSHKAFAKLHDREFYDYAIDALDKNVSQLYLVSHPDLEEEFQNRTTAIIVQDLPEFRGDGPLAGIYTVMQKTMSDWFVVLPCDTPFVTNNLIKQLISFTNDKNIDAIVPVINERKQPLIAVYHSRVSEKIEKMLMDKNLKMSSLLAECNVKYVTNQELQFQDMEFENINNISEYEKLQQKPI
ncbi:molybdenum cofactor guanylyltransferase [Bacillus sinesaloumensis]|uniref:molybdenum cofactor guanylyltransferase n=1 Tax=Litchfieldia sinesaloumensis TaxID=1926280 RepID=UPI0013564601|nr:molybdenum cofactor guanylyltransferase [Bacillus sinesaloumensis]